MDRKSLAQQLKDNPLLGELIGAWRQDLIDAMLTEGRPERRESLWAEQRFIGNLIERLESELSSIIGRRESTDESE